MSLPSPIREDPIPLPTIQTTDAEPVPSEEPQQKSEPQQQLEVEQKLLQEEGQAVARQTELEKQRRQQEALSPLKNRSGSLSPGRVAQARNPSNLKGGAASVVDNGKAYIDEKCAQLDKKIDGLSTKMDTMDTKITDLSTTMDTKITYLSTNMGTMATKITDLSTKMGTNVVVPGTESFGYEDRVLLHRISWRVGLLAAGLPLLAAGLLGTVWVQRTK